MLCCFSAVGLSCDQQKPMAAERRISRESYGDRWPFTVDDGILSCVALGKKFNVEIQGVYFRVGATTYGVNGSARERGGPGVEAIVKNVSRGEPREILSRVPEVNRRELFRAIVACEDQANRVAECKRQVRARYKLTGDELDLVADEGLVRYWPPLEPQRVDTKLIIDDGLKLCSR
jgi:hypothetical protein